MRKLLISLLLAATAATPALAMQNEGPPGARRGGHERAVQRDDARPQPRKAQRQAREARAPRQVQAVPRAEGRAQWRGDQRRGDQARGDRNEQRVRQTPIRPSVPAQVQAQADRRDGRRDFRQDRQDGRRDLRNGQYAGQRDIRRDRQDDRRDVRQDRRDDRPNVRRDRQNDQRDWRNNRDNDRRWDRGHDNRRWDRDWRRDQRYDWQRYRNQNRRSYHLPRYYAPRGYGYGYNRFSIGVTIGSAFFGSGYWINDPWMYRLPPAYGDYRWVRYYDDVLLVDLRTGYVVDVIYDFFY